MKLLFCVIFLIVLQSTTGDYDYNTNPITNQADISDEIESKAEMTISFNQSIGNTTTNLCEYYFFKQFLF